MKINDTYLIQLHTPNMDGICDEIIQGQHVLIRHGIEHEKVEIQITKKIKEGFIGEITKILVPSINRIQSPCFYSNKCGGCTYNHLTYESQCELKTKQIQSLFRNEKIKVHPIIPADKNRAYRNKTIYTFQSVKKNIRFGFYQENTHYVENIDTCLNHDELTTKILNTIRSMVLRYKMEVFNEDTGSGIVRHVLIRRAKDQTLVCLVVSKEFKGSKNFARELVQKIPEITTILLNMNPRKTSVVLGNTTKVLYGKGFIVDTLCSHTYQLSASSFYQIHHDQCEKLYETAIKLCDLKPTDVVLDMYCGIGTIGMSLADKVRKVIGVEINEQSVINARNNAKMNGISNISFECVDATDYMKKTARKKEKIDVVIMDPPRSGSTPVFIENCIAMNPKKILYISCNPVTQLRDLKTFQKYGYTTKEVIPFDLFPYSSHVETVMLISKISARK